MAVCVFDPLRRHHINARLHAQKNKSFDDFYAYLWQGLVDRVMDVKHGFNRTLIIGPEPTPEILAPLIQNNKINPAQINHADFDDHDLLAVTPGSYDLVLVSGVLNTVNDIQTVLLQLRFALAPEGCMMAVFPGEDSLHELRDALARAESTLYGGLSPRVHPMIDARALSGIMQQAQFHSPVVDCERTILEYQDFYKLLGDLRAIGQTNILVERPRAFVKQRFFDCGREQYPMTPNGYYPATLTLVHAMGWAPK